MIYGIIAAKSSYVARFELFLIEGYKEHSVHFLLTVVVK